MNILGRLALVFVAVPILELMLLIRIGEWVGFVPTLLLVVFTGVTGAWLARAEGVRVFFQFQRELASGSLPGQALLDGLSVLVGGAFLLTPGIITDVAGFSLLFPPTRRWIQRGVKRRLKSALAAGSIQVVGFGPGTGGAGRFGFGTGANGDPPRPDPSAAEPRHPGGTGAARGGSGPDPLEGRDPSQGIDIDQNDASDGG